MGYNIDNIIVNLKKQIQESGGGSGTSDYSQLTNKPQINEVTLSGNKSLSDLGIASASDLAAVEALIPESASTSNQLATASDIPDDVTGNPSGSATAGNLNKLQIGSNIYNVPSGSLNLTLIKTITVSLSDWGESSGGVRNYNYSLLDIFNQIRSNKIMLIAYETNGSNFYKKMNVMDSTVSIPEMWGESTDPAYVSVYGSRAEWYSKIALHRNYYPNVSDTFDLELSITDAHYQQWQSWTDNQLIIKIYTID